MAERNKDRGESKLARGGERGRPGGTARYEPRLGGPFGLMEWMFDRMQRDFFEPLFERGRLARPWGREMPFERMAQVDLRETDQEIVVTAELPGLAPEDIHVECRQNTLTLRGESREAKEAEGEQYQGYASFYRQIPLPDDVDVDKAQASFKNGLLRIRFPRQPESSQVRRIPVSGERGTERAA